MSSHFPVLDVAFPRPVVALHQIEITSRCNLRCVYCTSPQIVDGKFPKRPAGDMTRATFVRALEWVHHFTRQGTQEELNLAGIGESTLHPEFVDFVRLAREAVGPAVKLVFATNGLVVDESLARAIAPFKPEVWVSMHRPEKGGPAAEYLNNAGILGGISCDAGSPGGANDWAGQVKWKKPIYKLPCQWLREGKAFVYSTGELGACCLDASGAGVIGHVNDTIGSVKSRPYGLCAGCYQEIGVAGYDQWNARSRDAGPVPG